MTEKVQEYDKYFGAILTAGLEALKEIVGIDEEELTYLNTHKRNSRIMIDAEFASRYLEFIKVHTGLKSFSELGEAMGLHRNTLYAMFPPDEKEVEWTVKSYCTFIDWLEGMIYDSNQQ